MSLAINTNTVMAVLLADGWHEVDWIEDDISEKPGRMVSSFDLDAYEYIERHPRMDYPGFQVRMGGGTIPGVPQTGFGFRDKATGQEISGPVTSILAVRNVDSKWQPASVTTRTFVDGGRNHDGARA